jgi:nitrogen fixation/metabolism regulation signal transduction histidine kinase
MSVAPAPRGRPRRCSSLGRRLVGTCCALVTIAVGCALRLQAWVGEPLLAAAISVAVLLPLTILLVRHPLSPVFAMFRALSGTVTSYRDGDFAFSLAWPKNDELFVLRHLTSEIRREEVRTWKKVIRVISHELNNSLAPIGYARFAKLPAPRLEVIHWAELVERLRTQIPFQLLGALPDHPARADPAQLEQALVNLVRNAHESGSPITEISLRVRRHLGSVAIEVCDRGSGMNQAALSSALLPFYSTKRDGTGLGLALVREIAEAHGGRVALANRPDGGLCVTFTLPQ